MTDEFPRNQIEFEERFATEESCVAYLRQRRWPNGFRCPRCDGTRGWPVHARALDECATCGHQASVTAGTVFARTRKPLRVWFRVLAEMLFTKSGCSAVDLSRRFGLSYQTAWVWLHKLRACMDRSDGTQLVGPVEVDETYIGGHDEAPYSGRKLGGHKMLVYGAAECRGKGIGRIRLQVGLQVTTVALCTFVATRVARGAMVRTDGYRSYRALATMGFSHKPLVAGAYRSRASVQLPRIHRVFSLVDRWLLGTLQGSVTLRHLKAYLDEFVFRFNRRSSKRRGLLFERLIGRGFRAVPTYHEIVARPLQVVTT